MSFSSVWTVASNFSLHSYLTVLIVSAPGASPKGCCMFYLHSQVLSMNPFSISTIIRVVYTLMTCNYDVVLMVLAHPFQAACWV